MFVHLVGFCSIVLMLFAAWWIVLVLWDLDCLLWFRIVCVCWSIVLIWFWVYCVFSCGCCVFVGYGRSVRSMRLGCLSIVLGPVSRLNDFRIHHAMGIQKICPAMSNKMLFQDLVWFLQNRNSESEHSSIRHLGYPLFEFLECLFYLILFFCFS